MVQRSKAYTDCGRVFARGIALVKLYLKLHELPRDQLHLVPKEARLTDLVRSAIVLCVSAMDAYYTRRFVETLVPFVKKKGLTEDLASLLEEAGLDTRQAIQIATMERPFRRIRALVYRYLEKRATQKFGVIDRLFLCFGLANFTANVQAMVERKTLLQSVQKLVERRHQIVHNGDLDKHGHLRKIDAAQIYKRLRDLSILVDYSEQLLNEAFH